MSLFISSLFLLVDFSLSRSSQHLSSPHFAKDVRSSSRLRANQPSNSTKKNGPHCSIVLKKILGIHCLDQLRSHVHPWTNHCGQGNGMCPDWPGPSHTLLPLGTRKWGQTHPGLEDWEWEGRGSFPPKESKYYCQKNEKMRPSQT